MTCSSVCGFVQSVLVLNNLTAAGSGVERLSSVPHPHSVDVLTSATLVATGSGCHCLPVC